MTSVLYQQRYIVDSLSSDKCCFGYKRLLNAVNVNMLYHAILLIQGTTPAELALVMTSAKRVYLHSGEIPVLCCCCGIVWVLSPAEPESDSSIWWEKSRLAPADRTPSLGTTGSQGLMALQPPRRPWLPPRLRLLSLLLSTSLSPSFTPQPSPPVCVPDPLLPSSAFSSCLQPWLPPPLLSLLLLSASLTPSSPLQPSPPVCSPDSLLHSSAYLAVAQGLTATSSPLWCSSVVLLIKLISLYI